jgi:hypothetical protein
MGVAERVALDCCLLSANSRNRTPTTCHFFLLGSHLSPQISVPVFILIVLLIIYIIHKKI